MGDDSIASFNPSNAKNASVDATHDTANQLITISAVAAGDTNLDAFGFSHPGGGLAHDPLIVFSFPAISWFVGFHVVTDTGGISADVSLTDISAAFSNMTSAPNPNSVQAIWQQVNVLLSFANPLDTNATAKFPTNPMILDRPQSNTNTNTLFSRVNPGADYDVYFVYSLSCIRGCDGQTRVTNQCDGTGGQSHGYSIVATHDGLGKKFPANELAIIIAHELGGTVPVVVEN
jgi:hypothetical protein